MPLDHSKATVTIEVAGIAISCINRRERNRCEIGILRCDRHRPILDIQEIKFDPTNGVPIRSSLRPHSLSLNEDILIEVVNPGGSHCDRGTTQYIRRDFRRSDDTGDAEDFRWIADLEGKEFHNRKLRIKDASKLQPTIFLNDGILYTRQKTDEVFARYSLEGRPSEVTLGKLAYGISADLICAPGGEVVLSNVSSSRPPEDGGCSVRLRQAEGTRYRISIENHCQLQAESEGTDFRLFYEVLKDPEGKEFDLRRIVETGCYASPEEALQGRADFSLDGFPESCVTVFLGQTPDLGH